jgi:hypothetical protein
MFKVIIVREKEGQSQALAGLVGFCGTYGGKVDLTMQLDFLEVRCPENFVSGLLSLVEKYGYWASEIQELKIRLGMYLDHVDVCRVVQRGVADVAVKMQGHFCLVYARPCLVDALMFAGFKRVNDEHGVAAFHYTGSTNAIEERLSRFGEVVCIN